MKKVLILAYDFPPYVSVGALRPHSWFKYFNKFSIYPIVITRQWNIIHNSYLDHAEGSKSNNIIIDESDYGVVIKSPYTSNIRDFILLKFGKSKYKNIRKILTLYYEVFQFIFFNGSKSSIYKVATEYLNLNKVDLIIATGEPFVLFKYASQLSKVYDIPWLADYRDLWSLSNNRSKNFFFKKWNLFFEKKYVESAHTLITVSELLKIKLSTIHKNKNIIVIKNGHDVWLSEDAKNINQNKQEFSIAFAGSIYKYHPVYLFLDSCNDWFEKNLLSNFKIYFYGINIEDDIRSYIENKNNHLKHIVKIIPKTPQSDLVSLLSTHNVFLLFNDYSISGTKIYDYIALKRKIILCFSNDTSALELYRKYFSIKNVNNINNRIQQDIIEATNSGIIVEDSEQLPRVLDQLYYEFKEHGKIHCFSKNIEQYSRKVQIEKLAQFIHHLLENYSKRLV